MKDVTIRIYSEADRKVVENALKRYRLPESWISFDSCSDEYAYNEVFVRLPDSDFETLMFRLNLKKPDVYEMG